MNQIHYAKRKANNRKTFVGASYARYAVTKGNPALKKCVALKKAIVKKM